MLQGKRLRRWVWVPIVLALAGVSATSVGAEDGSPSSDGSDKHHGMIHEACAGDIEKLCGDAKGHAVVACLKSHSDAVSKPCSDALAKMGDHKHP